MILALGIISFGYIFLILLLSVGFKKVPEPVGKHSTPNISFSIVVPYRNEVEGLPSLLKSFAAIEYPSDLFQIILVDDSSEDTSAEICRSFKTAHPRLEVELLSALRLSAAPKKAALQKAIRKAKHAYILTTDADCEVSPDWLKAMNTCIMNTKAEMISGPVMLRNDVPGFLQRFQELDFLSLQGATMGGFGIGKPFLCNAANLCFRRESFLEVDGYQGNQDIGSGDDIFLMEKFITSKRRIAFLKSAQTTIYTNAQVDLASLVSQRIRWAAKSSRYKDPFAKGVGLLVFLMNFCVVLAFIMTLLHKFPFQVFLSFFVIKGVADFLLIRRSAHFFGRQEQLRNFPWVCCIYPFFTSFVAIASLFSGYEWKGRRFKK